MDAEEKAPLTDEECREIFEKFVERMLTNMKPMPREFAEVVDEHFWELLM